MDCKQFFKPQISKVIILILLILIFGVPATSSNCQTYVTTSTPPPCIERFTFSNIILGAMGLTKYPYMLDAATNFSYNPIVVIIYLVAMYLSLSLIFHLSGYNWKKSLLYVILIVFIILLIFMLSSLMGTKTYVK